MNELLQKLSNASLIDEASNIVLERYTDGVQVVDPETFEGFFGGTDYSYAALVAADQGKGYTRFFDKWKAAGIL